jgi:hypothetical protein
MHATSSVVGRAAGLQRHGRAHTPPIRPSPPSTHTNSSELGNVGGTALRQLPPRPPLQDGSAFLWRSTSITHHAASMVQYTRRPLRDCAERDWPRASHDTILSRAQRWEFKRLKMVVGGHGPFARPWAACLCSAQAVAAMCLEAYDVLGIVLVNWAGSGQLGPV